MERQHGSFRYEKWPLETSRYLSGYYFSTIVSSIEKVLKKKAVVKKERFYEWATLG